MEGEVVSVEVVSVNAGKPQTVTYQGRELSTGIYKQPVTGPVYLDWAQLEGDGQADLRYHGGPDKALCVYSADHYPYWENVLKRPLAPAAFGENITVRGLTEEEVCIGDIFQLGEAVVQVSQPRQPCFKLNVRYGRVDLVVLVQQTGFSGFYFRVLQPGLIGTDMPFRLLERQQHEVSVAFVNRIKYHDTDNRAAIEQILAVKELADSWRASFETRLQAGKV